MTNVGEYTEIIKRHHVTAPIEHGVLSDLEMVVHLARKGTGSTYDDAARLVPDDENVHVVWEEVVDADYHSDLEALSRWVAQWGSLEQGHQFTEIVRKWRAAK